MRALQYAFEEAVASLWRGQRAAAVAVITITAALAVLGVLLLVTLNVEQLLAQWTASAELSVYLRADASAQELAAVEQALEASPLVAGREYVSKEQALERFRRDFNELASIAGGTTDNPFPPSYDVRLRPEAGDPRDTAALATRLEQLPGVTDVRYDRRWLERVMLAIALVRGVGLVIVSILAVAAALTVVNVVRLACYARRDEIEIMRLVGAPIAYVRGPFVMEGVLQGGLGAIVALGLLWGGYLTARLRYETLAADVLGLASMRFLPADVCGMLVLGGMLVGCVGGLIGAASTRETFAGGAPGSGELRR